MARLSFRKSVSDWLSVVGITFTASIGFCILIMIAGAILAWVGDPAKGLSITAVGLGLTSVILGLISVGLYIEFNRKEQIIDKLKSSDNTMIESEKNDMEMIKSDLRDIKDQVSDSAKAARRHVYLYLGFAIFMAGVGLIASHLLDTLWVGVTFVGVAIIVFFYVRFTHKSK